MKDNSDGIDISEVDYGIDGGYWGIYDGIIAWKMLDGRMINRWTGVVGYERQASLTQMLIDKGVLV